MDNDTSFVPVKNFQVVYGIPKDSTNLAYEDYYTSDYYLVASGGGDAAYFITLLVIAAFACFMCSRRVWKNEKMPDYLPKGSQSLPEGKPFLFRFSSGSRDSSPPTANAFSGWRPFITTWSWGAGARPSCSAFSPAPPWSSACWPSWAS